jgi:hypothetical protein
VQLPEFLKLELSFALIDYLFALPETLLDIPAGTAAMSSGVKEALFFMGYTGSLPQLPYNILFMISILLTGICAFTVTYLVNRDLLRLMWWYGRKAVRR